MLLINVEVEGVDGGVFDSVSSERRSRFQQESTDRRPTLNKEAAAFLPVALTARWSLNELQRRGDPCKRGSETYDLLAQRLWDVRQLHSSQEGEVGERWRDNGSFR